MFGIVLLLLLVLVAIYFMMIACAHKISFIGKIRDLIYKKLFYNGFLRYMIVSNLKLTYTVFGFFFVFYGFDTSMSTIKTIGCISIIALLLIYPLWTMIFLQRRHGRLEEEFYKIHFSSLFDGIEVDRR